MSEGERVSDSTKQDCGCELGCCYLQNDSAWAKRNYTLAHESDRPGGRLMWQSLEADRLGLKSAWLEGLGVMGVCQVRCRVAETGELPD